jgi:SAM-dependent methyltransferase
MAPKVTAQDFKISPEAFAYLRIQQGKLSNLLPHKRAWEAAYKKAMDEDFALISPYLPKFADGIHFFLDVGSGLGGIDILIKRYYKSISEECYAIAVLLDGAFDPPRMDRHAKTFNNMQVADYFHKAQGSSPISGIDANDPEKLWLLSKPAELVLSLQSWCFHYPPDAYLDFVRANLAPWGARIILDVRKDKPEWRDQLMAAFRWRAVIHTSDKFDRMVFDAD